MNISGKKRRWLRLACAGAATFLVILSIQALRIVWHARHIEHLIARQTAKPDMAIGTELYRALCSGRETADVERRIMFALTSAEVTVLPKYSRTNPIFMSVKPAVCYDARGIWPRYTPLWEYSSIVVIGPDAVPRHLSHDWESPAGLFTSDPQFSAASPVVGPRDWPVGLYRIRISALWVKNPLRVRMRLPRTANLYQWLGWLLRKRYAVCGGGLGWPRGDNVEIATPVTFELTSDALPPVRMRADPAAEALVRAGIGVLGAVSQMATTGRMFTSARPVWTGQNPLPLDAVFRVTYRLDTGEELEGAPFLLQAGDTRAPLRSSAAPPPLGRDATMILRPAPDIAANIPGVKEIWDGTIEIPVKVSVTENEPQN